MDSLHSSQLSLRPKSLPESVGKVLNTTELLEMILSWLPLPSLLRVQAVSTGWKNLVRDSSLLQQKLFLKGEKTDKIWLVDISNLPAQQNPLRRDYRSFTRVVAEVPSNSDVLKFFRGLVATPVRVNHLFLRRDPFLKIPESIDKKVDRGYVAEYAAPLNLLLAIKQHSMRDMLLTQPPVTHLCVEVLVKRRPHEHIDVGLTFRQSSDYGLYSAKIIEPGGVRLHQIAEALKRIQMLHRAESIKIFMCGVVEGTEEESREARKRTEKWLRRGEVQT
jgi:hypothetical protein